MNTSMSRTGGRRSTLGVLALAVLTLAGCNVDKMLNLTDPDIINPSDLANPAGAEAERIGALGRLNQATSGTVAGVEATFFLYGGLMADEYRSGDTFIERNATDQRDILTNNANIQQAIGILHAARVSAFQAHEALKKYAPNAPKWEVAEMYVAEAFTENMLAENLCNGIPLSYTLEGGVKVFGSPLTNAEVYARALAHYDTALILVGNTAGEMEDTTRWKAMIGRGRVLLNLARFADAATAVASVPTDFVWQQEHAQTTTSNVIWSLNISGRRYTVAENEGPLGLNFHTANDPRVPTCKGGTAGCPTDNPKVFDPGATFPLWVQKLWTEPESPVTIASGVEARLIQAEALLQAGNATWLDTLNILRSRVSGLAPLTDPGNATARQDLLFRERAFWLFSTGHRLPDLRRLMRAPYGRTQAQVFPTGAYIKGGSYGSDVNFPVTQAEENNPNFHGCIDRNA
ncbi:MAG TPA: RagB/SusD family nutrient uptake outer membrane protein [Gemmatimonadaceae bacterium]|nr:RagB/SusD family nutrient uptake outer membrane protein [Gemmatimonadaceae bacterium]